jgi:hypothetical protein
VVRWEERGLAGKDGTGGKARRHWTSRVESAKVWLFLAQILVVVVLVILGILDELSLIERGYIDLPGILVPLAFLVVALGFEGLVIYVLLCVYRPDPQERVRDHRAAVRAAVGAAIASFVVFAILFAPPIQSVAEGLAGSEYMADDPVFQQTMNTRDVLNLTTPQQVRLVAGGDNRFDVELYQGDSVSAGVLLERKTNVTSWSHGFEPEDDSEYVVFARGNNTTGYNSWTMKVDRELRDEMITQVAMPFLLLGIANAAWAPVARWRGARDQATYVADQKRRLRARFKVEEAFLIYEDGRLIAHNSRRLKPERDKDITTGMLTAVQSFVTDTFMDEEKGTMDQLKYGNLSILIEPQGKVNLACIVSGEAAPVLREGMRNILSYVNNRYRLFLEDWDGDIDRFRDVKKFIGHLVSTGAEEAVVPDEVFLIHRDGKLIAHQTSRLEPSIDDVLLQAFVGECLSAVRAAMDDPAAPIVQVAQVSEWAVLFEYNTYMCLAFMSTRAETEAVRERMADLLASIDERFREQLYEWDGATSELTDLKTMLEVVFAQD